MNELWAIGGAILAVDVANPVLLAAVMLAVSGERPITTSVAVIIGHTVAYFLAGVLIVFGLADWLQELVQPLIDQFNSPRLIDYVFGMIIGVLLIWVALQWRTDPPKPSEKPRQPKSPGLVPAVLFGAVVNFAGMPFALPYFAFIAEILQAPESVRWTALIVYNLAYAVPFLIVPAAVAVVGPSIMPLLNKVNTFVERYSVYILPLIFIGLGIFMILDAGFYFVRGTGLI